MKRCSAPTAERRRNGAGRAACTRQRGHRAKSAAETAKPAAAAVKTETEQNTTRVRVVFFAVRLLPPLGAERTSFRGFFRCATSPSARAAVICLAVSLSVRGTAGRHDRTAGWNSFRGFPRRGCAAPRNDNKEGFRTVERKQIDTLCHSEPLYGAKNPTGISTVIQRERSDRRNLVKNNVRQ